MVPYGLETQVFSLVPNHLKKKDARDILAVLSAMPKNIKPHYDKPAQQSSFQTIVQCLTMVFLLTVSTYFFTRLNQFIILGRYLLA